MDVDNYLSPKNHAPAERNSSSQNYSSVKNARLKGELDFEPTRDNPVFKVLKQDKSDAYDNHCNFQDRKYNTVARKALEYKEELTLNQMRGGNFCYKNLGYNPSDQLLNLILKDVSVYAAVAEGAKHSYKKLLNDYQKKHKRKNDGPHNRIYLHL